MVNQSLTAQGGEEPHVVDLVLEFECGLDSVVERIQEGLDLVGSSRSNMTYSALPFLLVKVTLTFERSLLVPLVGSRICFTV